MGDDSASTITAKDPSPRIVREQVERILRSSEFAQAERMCRFLRLVVQYSLERRAGELKEYLIGVEVFDRKPSYDPRLDPIVRVEARRLRLKLERYYTGEGRADEIVIDLPKGSYAATFSRPPRGAESAAKPNGTIAVLPFANLSGDDENEYFSDGLTQELIHGLTRVEGLRVVAWNSAVQLKGAEHDLHAIARQFNVETVLTGSVRKSSNRVRIAVQLIQTAGNYYLWSETYDRELEDLLQIQDEISHAIVSALRITLAGHQCFPRGRSADYNFKAHNLYLKGRFHLGKRTVEGINRSVRCFEQAVEIDTGFALGWAGLADSCSLLADYGLLRPGDIMPRAKQAALKAIELDPSLAEAWASLGLISALYEWEWSSAERYFRRAIALNPGYATAHHWYSSDYLSMLGRFPEALSEIAIARQMDPWSTIIVEGHGSIHMFARRYDEAINIYREALELDPHFYKSWSSIGRTLIQQRQYDEAVEMLERARSHAGDIPNLLGALGQAHALAGRPDLARALLGKLQALSAQSYVPAACSAIIHLGLGEHEQALDLLERGCDNREASLVALKVHPLYDNLRGHPRFARLLSRLHFLDS